MMSVSQVAIQQREEESRQQKIFLVCSISASLVLHIAVLVSGIVDLLKSFTKEETIPKPIEVTFIDIPPKPPQPVEKKPQLKLSPPPELPKTKIVKIAKVAQNSPQLPLPSSVQIEEKTDIIKPTSAGSNSNSLKNFSQPKIRPLQPLITPYTFKKSVSQSRKISENIPKSEPESKPVISAIPEIKPEITPRFTPRNFTTPEPIQTPVVNTIPESKPEITPRFTPRNFTTLEPIQTPVVNTIPEITIPKTTTPKTRSSSFSTSAPMNSENLEKLRSSLAKTPNNSSNTNSSNNLRTSREFIPGDNQGNLNNPISNNSMNTDNYGNSNSNTSTGSGTLRNTFTGESNTNNKTPLNSQTSNSGDGRASCVQCGTSYPSWARRRGVEGRIVVAVDTNSEGNVINVQLVSSSGSNRLDEEHLQIVRGWKLKPSENGRKEVTISTEYILK